MPEIRISAEPRTEFGKGAARRTRRANRVPAVVYGHGTAPLHVSLPEHDLMLALKHANVLLELDLEKGRELTLPKSVQRDPVRLTLEHVDLVIVKRGERVTVEVAVVVSGSPASGGVIDLAHPTVTIEAPATSIPESIAVDLDKAEPGTAVHADDLVLPDGVVMVLDPETLVVHVLSPQVEALPETEAVAEGEEAAEGAEPAGEDAPTDES